MERKRSRAQGSRRFVVPSVRCPQGFLGEGVGFAKDPVTNQEDRCVALVVPADRGLAPIEPELTHGGLLGDAVVSRGLNEDAFRWELGWQSASPFQPAV